MSDLTGKRFGRLVVLYKSESKDGSYWHCKCDCGNETDVYAGSLNNGVTKSCGCYRRDMHKTHGRSNTRLYNIWAGMLQRCFYDKHIDRKWYSANGIDICDEWKSSFETFYKWSVNNGYADGLSIDRIDNNKGYNPSNCKWSSPKEQANNRRTNINVSYNGQTKTLKQWAETLGIKYSTLYYRYVTAKKPFNIAIK